MDINQQNIDLAICRLEEALMQCTDVQMLKAVYKKHTADGSDLFTMRAGIKHLPLEDRSIAGRMISEAMDRVKVMYEEMLKKCKDREMAAALQKEAIDMTSLEPSRPLGGRHPLGSLMEDLVAFFTSLGWKTVQGPELDNIWYNFDGLNFAKDHPARAMQDTFFVDGADGKHLLRTHTSTVQLRSLFTFGVPIYVVAPGRVYRSDVLDSTHTPVFTQIEGLAVDRGLNMSHLVGVLEAFAAHVFGPETKVRLRTNYFPFTEPSAEMDIWSPGHGKWIEWGGCGMVHPNVLASAGIDSREYTGFAFGMGLERTLMFRYGILDVRDLVTPDLRISQNSRFLSRLFKGCAL